VNNRVFLSLFCCIVIVSLLAVPALAATVTCPSSCSCLLPAEAKKAVYDGYCGGKQQVCAYDAAKNEKYCYEKTASKALQPVAMVKTSSAVTKTATATKTTTPATVTKTATATKMTTPAAAQCPAGCSCLAPDKADAAGYTRCSGSSAACSADPLGRPMYCYMTDKTTIVSKVPAGTTAAAATTTAVPVMLVVTTAATPPGGNILGAIGTFFGALLGSPPACSTASQTILCNGSLADIMSDEANCGACGTVCRDGQCIGGSCRTSGPEMTTSCPRFEIQCDGVCKNIMFDEKNCGACGNICGSGTGCCSGTCVDLSSMENCGACGNRCPRLFSTCEGNACACFGSLQLCNRGCTDFQTDRENCGSCGYGCQGGWVCAGGTCVSTSISESNCGGIGIECRDEETCCASHCVTTGRDEVNCGSCGNACAGEERCCGGSCTDLQSDEENCGACTVTCPDGRYCCSGHCVRLDTETHCGSCRRSCSWYERCLGGECMTPGDTIADWWSSLWS